MELLKSAFRGDKNPQQNTTKRYDETEIVFFGGHRGKKGSERPNENTFKVQALKTASQEGAGKNKHKTPTPSWDNNRNLRASLLPSSTPLLLHVCMCFVYGNIVTSICPKRATND